LAGNKKAKRIEAIVASKNATVSKDKNTQRGEYEQQKYPPHNLTNTDL
jgi:hypothetical protein